MKPLGSRFRTALTALAVCGLLAAAVTTPAVAAAGDDPQLEQLWNEFPLDDRNEGAVTDQPVRNQATNPRTPVAQRPETPPAAVQQPTGGADDRSFGFATLVAVIAVLVGATGILLVRAGPLRRRRRVSGPAPSQARPRLALAVAAGAPSPPSPGQDRVVEGLVEVPAERPPEQRKSKEVKMREITKAAQPSDPLALKAGRSETDALKSGPSAAEHEALKRKLAVEVELLKAKKSSDPALLKEKLISGQRQAQAVKDGAPTAKAGQQPAQSRGRGDLGKRRSVRPLRVVDTQEPPADGPGVAEAAVECEVRWWRGYVNSHFFAVQRGAEGPESILAASSPFRWRKSEPPPQTPATVSALASLVDPLLGEGWVTAGRGAHWFAVRLRRAKLHSTASSPEEFPIHANGGR